MITLDLSKTDAYLLTMLLLQAYDRAAQEGYTQAECEIFLRLYREIDDRLFTNTDCTKKEH